MSEYVIRPYGESDVFDVRGRLAKAVAFIGRLAGRHLVDEPVGVVLSETSKSGDGTEPAPAPKIPGYELNETDHGPIYTDATQEPSPWLDVTPEDTTE